MSITGKTVDVGPRLPACSRRRQGRMPLRMAESLSLTPHNMFAYRCFLVVGICVGISHLAVWPGRAGTGLTAQEGTVRPWLLSLNNPQIEPWPDG